MSKKTRIIVIVLVVLFLPTLVWLGGTALYQLRGQHGTVSVEEIPVGDRQ